MAHWEMNGNASDISGNGHNGMLIGGIQAAPNRFGSNGCAIVTSSSANYIDVPGEITIDSTKGATISFWSKVVPVDPTFVFGPDAYYNIRTQAIKLDERNLSDGIDRIEEQLNSPVTSLSCSLWVNKNFAGDYIFNDCAQKWNHTVLIINVPKTGILNYQLYKNNVKLQSIGNLSTSVFNKLKVSLAKNVLYQVYDNINNTQVDLSKSVKFEYYLDEVRIYNKELSLTEIDQLFRETNTCTITSLNTEQAEKAPKQLLKAINF